jgi:polar amino acid transport system substrate-binding protein
MQKRFLSLVIAVLMAFVTSSCATTDVSKSVEVAEVDTLLVGVTPDFPPLIYKRGNEVIGVEADLAYKLAERMNRKVQFIDLKWKEQIPALLRGEIDIVMAGMSMTGTREIRIKFSDHYMKSGLVTMMRAEDKPKFNSLEVITESLPNVGVVSGTTSEIFVRRNFPKATNVVALQESDHAPSALIRRAIDIFIYDAPAILWLVSENEAELSVFWEPFNEEKLAWAVRRDDEEFLSQVNGILQDMRTDGQLDQILLKWLPSEYLERFR